ncbi:hypothetical protein OEZ86_010493 [Tetradesmus obliquus]|nr:hypothetical protein OEZ86_010493 [Tetradesmus obliquus]
MEDASRGGSKRCQVVGCSFDLTAYGRRYHSKKRLCPEHLKAEAVQLCDTEGLFRFCQQCGKLERLEAFAGTKRSCRLGLHKRRLNHAACAARQQQQQRGRPHRSSSSGSSASCSGCNASADGDAARRQR